MSRFSLRASLIAAFVLSMAIALGIVLARSQDLPQVPPLTLTTALIVGPLCAALLAAIALRPLDRLRSQAQAVAEGRRARVEEPDSPEDLRTLAVAINHLVDRAETRNIELSQERAEQASVLASLQEGVIVLNADARIESVNRLAAEWFEVTPEAVAGQPLESMLRNPPVHGLVRGILAGASENPDNPTIERSGRLLRVRATRLGGPDTSAGVLLVLADVTRLERLERIRRDFVANVSHELKTPITAVKGYLETLLDGALDDPANARNFTEIALRQADRLNAIIEDLLSLSRIEQETESGEVPRENLPLRQTLLHAVESCLARADDAGVNLRLECDSELHGSVSHALLEQAVTNLIENAVKHSPRGADVTIRAALSRGMLSVQVIDAGCGIPAEHLPRLFERFYRVDKARSRQSGGTGLGLSIVMRIARAHGGNVAVSSVVERGSTFTITIPA